MCWGRHAQYLKIQGFYEWVDLTNASSGWLQGHEPFVSYEGLEQLHRFLFVLGITHVLYSFLAVGLAMSKVQSLVPVSESRFTFEQLSSLLPWGGVQILAETSQRILSVYTMKIECISICLKEWMHPLYRRRLKLKKMKPFRFGAYVWFFLLWGIARDILGKKFNLCCFSIIFECMDAWIPSLK